MFQIVLISLYRCIPSISDSGFQLDFSCPLVAGFAVGVIVGNVPLGTYIGGTLVLMGLGLHTYGGTSIPDFTTSTLVATALATATPGFQGLPVEEVAALSLTFAVPLALILIQLDIARRTLNVFFQQLCDKSHKERKYHQIPWWLAGSVLFNMFTNGMPVFLSILIGPPMVEALANNIPAWLTNGIRTSGGILPAMGMALLLNYLPFKKYYIFYILGFTIFAYGRANFNLIAVSLFGFAAAMLWVMMKKQMGTAVVATEVEVEIDE
jgi:PTS system mannose-specific IIC component